jgi:hypothetical protein
MTIPKTAAFLAVLVLTACAGSGDNTRDPHPSDNQPEGAVVIAVGESVEDRIGPTPVDSADWKSFTVAGDSRLRVRLRIAATPSALKLSVVNRRNGRHVGTLTGQPGQEQSLVANFLSGVYHIEILAESEIMAIPYALVVEAAEP